MIQKFQIKTVKDVEAFLHYVLLPEPEGLGLAWTFHPDDDFSSYGKPDKDEALFSDEEAEQLNQTIDKCFEVCEKQHKDIYNLSMEIALNEC